MAIEMLFVPDNPIFVVFYTVNNENRGQLLGVLPQIVKYTIRNHMIKVLWPT